MLKDRLLRRLPMKSLAYGGAGAAIALLILFLQQYVCFINLLIHAFRTIIHEGGHALSSWFIGVPSIPKLSLDGNQSYAVALGEQSIPMALVAWAILIGATVWCFNRRFLWKTMIGVSVAFPIIAFVGNNHRIFVTLMGHGNELLIGGVFLWRASTGLFTAHKVERLLYAVFGWVLVFGDVSFIWSLMYDAAAMRQYMEADQPNDFAVVAYDYIGTPHISYVLVPMFIASLAVYPLALLATRGVKGLEDRIV